MYHLDVACMFMSVNAQSGNVEFPPRTTRATVPYSSSDYHFCICFKHVKLNFQFSTSRQNYQKRSLAVF